MGADVAESDVGLERFVGSMAASLKESRFGAQERKVAGTNFRRGACRVTVAAGGLVGRGSTLRERREASGQGRSPLSHGGAGELILRREETPKGPWKGWLSRRGGEALNQVRMRRRELERGSQLRCRGSRHLEVGAASMMAGRKRQ